MAAPAAPSFRIDAEIHQGLMRSAARPPLRPLGQTEALPEPLYPSRPWLHEQAKMNKWAYHLSRGWRGFRSWILPYIRARMHPDQFRPLLAYLFTEYKCNIDCHYCWSFNNKFKGMSEDTARRSLDRLHALGCRVLALTGGEPLLRPEFVHKLVYYGVQKGFLISVPSNGRTLNPKIIDRLGDAGVATINLAVDVLDKKPGLPKALNLIRPQFDYLVRRQHRFGYMIVLNININRGNLEDVRELTEIAYENGCSTEYHFNETPLVKQPHFQHLKDNPTFFRPQDLSQALKLINYLMDRSRRGYIMVNSISHLKSMKKFLRGKREAWPCRAGINTLVIRPDGSVAPCVAMNSARHDWGVLGGEKLDRSQLAEMKKSCSPHCLSNCNYTLGHYYHPYRVFGMALKQMAHSHQGLRGPMQLLD